jgi:hypothetical protein
MAFPGLVRNSLAGCAQTAKKEARFRKNQPLRHMRNIEEASECSALGIRGVRRDKWRDAGLAKSVRIFHVIPGMNGAASNTDLLSRAADYRQLRYVPFLYSYSAMFQWIPGSIAMKKVIRIRSTASFTRLAFP